MLSGWAFFLELLEIFLVFDPGGTFDLTINIYIQASVSFAQSVMQYLGSIQARARSMDIRSTRTQRALDYLYLISSIRSER